MQDRSVVYGWQSFLETGVKGLHAGLNGGVILEPQPRPLPMTLRSIPVLFALLLVAACARPSPELALPVGSLMDDYSFRYVISDSSWMQKPGNAYVIAHQAWDEQMIILEHPATDSTTTTWTRVDWIPLEGMAPWTWAYCYSAWDLPSLQDAFDTAHADRTNPREGCGGFPFSRMQPAP